MYKLYSLTISPLQRLLRENFLVQFFILSYFACTVAGWLILQMPICQKNFLSGLDVFFTAASAVSTTGLATVDVEKTFSLCGQLVLLCLIQFGGIGYMVFSSFIILSLKQKMRDQSLHPSWVQVRKLIKEVIIYTLICETVGLLFLYFFFKNDGIENVFLNALFHSISAFCTAGFSLFSSNLEGYQNHFAVNLILSSLSLLGALGFFLGIDLIKAIASGKKCIQFVTRMARSLVTTMILLGAFLFLLITPFTTENGGPYKLIVSFFQVIFTITTAGFNIIDIGILSNSALAFLTFLMLIGVSLIGSGTNMRGTSFFALLKLTSNIITRRNTSSRRKRVFLKRVQISVSAFSNYLVCLLIFSILLALIEKHPFLPIFFETASALSTVGLSTGITSELSSLGKYLIIFLMLTGRVGILIFGFASSTRALEEQEKKRIAIPIID